MAVDYRARAAQRAKERNTSTRFKLREGDNNLRVLPTPEAPDGSTPPVFYEFYVHFNVGPNDDTLGCGKSFPDEEGDCWLCDAMIPRLQANGKVKSAEKLMPKLNAVVQIAVVDENGKMSGPFVWNMPKTVGNNILSLLGSKKRDYADPETGYNFTITRTGTGQFDTRYEKAEPDDEPSVVPAEIMKKLLPFSALREIQKYDENGQKAAYTGKSREEIDEEAAAKTKTQTKKAAAPVAVEEEDDDDIPDTPPVKEKVAAKAKVVAAATEDDAPAPTKTKAKAALADDDVDISDLDELDNL